MARNNKKNRKRDSNNDNERFIPKYRIECYLMELNKVVDFELTYTEFEELMEVSELDVPTRMATIKFMIKKRRQKKNELQNSSKKKQLRLKRNAFKN